MKAIKVKISIMVCCCLMMLASSISASVPYNSSNTQQDTLLPKVFLIGEYEPQYEAVLATHETLLFTACEFNMDVAFDKWMSMLREMEAYADAINFDIKGTKLWMNVFWNEDGSVKHIAYYLKTMSRNIDTSELSAFFSSFMNNYKFPLVYSSKYSHYGSASFPLFPIQLDSEIDPKKKEITKTARN